MDRDEAKPILARHLDELEAPGYSELVDRVGQTDNFERQGQSNATYQIEILIRWEHKTLGAIIVLGAIDDGRGLEAFFPLGDSRLVQPGPKSPRSLAGDEHPGAA